MPILDCESFQSVVRSLVEIFSTTEKRLADFFHSVDLDDLCEANPQIGDASDVLLRFLVCEFGSPKTIEKVYWFHLTRVPEGTTFNEGIQPLNLALPRVWSMLFEMFAGTVHEARLRLMKETGVEDFQYSLKTRNSEHWGPYAMLVRDIAFCANQVRNSDYLKLPEIVEDICHGYLTQFGESIQDEVENQLVPTIVKFWVEGALCEHALEPAVYFAYTRVMHEPLSSAANTCFEATGVAIPLEQIVSIEYLA